MCRSPLVYVLDSPGVLQPSLGDPAHAARLALAGLLPPAAAGLDDQLLTRELVKVGQLWNPHLHPHRAALVRGCSRGAGRPAADQGWLCVRGRLWKAQAYTMLYVPFYHRWDVAGGHCAPEFGSTTKGSMFAASYLRKVFRFGHCAAFRSGQARP